MGHIKFAFFHRDSFIKGNKYTRQQAKHTSEACNFRMVKVDVKCNVVFFFFFDNLKKKPFIDLGSEKRERETRT